MNFATTVQLPRTWKLSHQVSVFYNGRTGNRYALGFNGDLNGDGVSNNELLFVPSSADQVIVYSSVAGQTVTWDMLDTYLQNDPAASQYRGQVMPRNAGRSPWQNQMDLQYALNIPTGGRTKAEITVNVFNFLNLLNANWGWQYWSGFPGQHDDRLRRHRCGDGQDALQPGDDHVEHVPGHLHARRPPVAVADAAGRAVQVLAAACGLRP